MYNISIVPLITFILCSIDFFFNVNDIIIYIFSFSLRWQHMVKISKKLLLPSTYTCGSLHMGTFKNIFARFLALLCATAQQSYCHDVGVFRPSADIVFSETVLSGLTRNFGDGYLSAISPEYFFLFKILNF